MNEKTVSRYIKVKALADRGSAGEQEAARRILASLESKNPGIADAAAQKLREEEKPEPTEGFNPFTTWRQGRGAGNWENIFQYAKWAYETVSDVAETVIEAQKGRELCEEEVEFSGRRRGQALFVSIKFPFACVETVREMNTLQKETFRQSIHDRLDEYLDAILEG